MKKIILLVMLLGCANKNVFAADCSVEVSHTRGMGNYILDRDVAKVKRIMSRKGYEVTESKDAAYHLEVGLDIGYVCGTGVTTMDSILRAPGGFRINFSGPDVETLEKSKDFETLTIVSDLISRFELFSAVRNLASCEEKEK